MSLYSSWTLSLSVVLILSRTEGLLTASSLRFYVHVHSLDNVSAM